MGKTEAETQEYTPHPYDQAPEAIIKSLQTNKDTGLAPAEVQQRQQRYGPNRLLAVSMLVRWPYDETT